MKKMPRFAVVLSGCGRADGSEIHESVTALLAIDCAGCTYQCYAPNINQSAVINNLTSQQMNETRNVLIESARIARGEIKDLKDLKLTDYDCILFPGGFGAITNWCDFAQNGINCNVEASVNKALEDAYKNKKIIGAMCIGHILIHITAAIHQLCEKQFLPEIYRSFYKKVIHKSISMEYTEFEKPEFYDKYTRALNECQWRGNTILYFSAYLVAGVASVIAATVIVADVDPMLLIFIVPMVAVSMFFGKKEGDLYYSLDMSNTRDGRIGSYAKRVFYEKKYAGELRLFGIGKILLSRHEKAYDEMEKRTWETRKKLCVIEPLKWILYNLLSTILPYLYVHLYFTILFVLLQVFFSVFFNSFFDKRCNL